LSKATKDDKIPKTRIFIDDKMDMIGLFKDNKIISSGFDWKYIDISTESKINDLRPQTTVNSTCTTIQQQYNDLVNPFIEDVDAFSSGVP
ncbi:15802_t:CDS:2, partial [Dentiscutata erythropus]